MRKLFSVILALYLLQNVTYSICNRISFEYNVEKYFRRIVGGNITDISKLSYQVSLETDGENGNVHFCGASILSKDWALTAAHCIILNRKAMYARVGSSERLSGGSLHDVVMGFPHKKYDRDTFDFDIGLVKVRPPFPIEENPKVKPIQLSHYEPPDGEEVIVSGWGFLHEKHTTGSEYLRSVEVKIVNRLKCRSYYKSEYDITRNMVCAGLQKGGKDACLDDSGGPLVSKISGLQVGIVSFGIGCASSLHPGVYANVVELLPWIRRITSLRL